MTLASILMQARQKTGTTIILIIFHLKTMGYGLRKLPQNRRPDIYPWVVLLLQNGTENTPTVIFAQEHGCRKRAGRFSIRCLI